MVHGESSKLSSFQNGSVYSEEKLATKTLRNRSYSIAPLKRQKSKRLKVAKVSEFPPECGSVSMNVCVETCENMNVSKAKVELIHGERVGERDQLKSVDETFCSDMGVGGIIGDGSHGDNDEDVNLPENTIDQKMVNAVEVQPLSICLPEEDGKSVCRPSIVGTKLLRRREIPVVRDFPRCNNFLKSEKIVKAPTWKENANLVLEKSDLGDQLVQSLSKTISPKVLVPLELEKSKVTLQNGIKAESKRKIHVVRDFPPWSNFSKSEKTVKVDAISNENKNLVMEKSVSRGHSSQSCAKIISPKVLVPLELEKSKITLQKPIEIASRRITRKGVVMHSPLELSKKLNGEFGEGSRRKNSEKYMQDKERLAQKSELLDVGLPLLCASGSNNGDSARSKVKEIQCLFNGALIKILGEEEARPKGKNVRVDFEASKLHKSKWQYLEIDAPIIGHVPGVEIGDEFQYQMEQNILGIHIPSQGGNDYITDEDEKLVDPSILSSGCYDDEVDNSDIVIYTGQGGNMMKVSRKRYFEPNDQQLITGNLALVNSKTKENPMRAIRGNKKTPSSGDAKNYVFDGLYVVEDFCEEIGCHGKCVYKFKLRRIPEQPELSWKVSRKSKKPRARDARYNVDLSEGKEKFPIYVVNDLDGEKPPPFIYSVEMIYPDWCRPIPPKGCGCKNGCAKSNNCACVAKNSGELTYNHDGAKPLMYECGPQCNCPPSCYLRVTQLGIRFQLEIFKTKSRGWGVRSLKLIPSGSFICKYVGELLDDKEAERRTGEDEYLFDIDKEDESSGFVIDAGRKGNIGRFINHSCSPNLYAREVLYDHEEKKIPHIMLFAGYNIPPHEELSYDYSYKIDGVRDSNGNIKKKSCYCGSPECTGRLY